MSFLGQFNDIGVISSAMTTLDDLAFIHLDLSIKNAKRSDLRLLNSKLSEFATWSSNPSEGMLHVLRILVPGAELSSSDDHTSEVIRHCGDYQTLIGPALGCTMPERRKRVAIWLSWQMDGAWESVAKPLAELFGCLPEVGLGKGSGTRGMINLEYLILRDIGNSVFRGRGKLSIPESDIQMIFGDNHLEVAAVKLCMSLEDAWKTALRRHGVRGVTELTVSWHEWWLGHWASPI